MHWTSRHFLRTPGFYTWPLVFKRRLSRHLNFNSILTPKWTKYFNSCRAIGTKSTAKQNSKAFSVRGERCVFWKNRVIKFRFLFSSNSNNEVLKLAEFAINYQKAEYSLEVIEAELRL